MVWPPSGSHRHLFIQVSNLHRLTYYYYYWYLFIFCYYLEQVISYFPIIIATIIIILFIYLQSFCTMLPCNSLCTASFEH